MRVADAMRLGEQDADDLLNAGGHSTVTELARRADLGERSLLASWIRWPMRGPPTSAPLPTVATPFVGRDSEQAAVSALVCDPNVRVVTLTGIGGVGKTRLAIEVAHAVMERFGDGVAFIELAPLTESALVPAFVAHALGTATDLNGIQTDPLVSRHQLVVLDNYEHVLESIPVIAKLVAGAPGLTLLVTSRAVLHLYGEHQFEVGPLSLPQTNDSAFDVIAANPAVALFTQRARAVKPAFQLVPENAGVIAEVCRRVDGLPLAIELAAARTAVLEPEGLLSRLTSHINVLTWGSRDLPKRHQSLESTLDWSVKQIDERASRLFANLSVFMSGWRLDAAEAIGVPLGATEVLDALMALVDHSLVRNVPNPRGGRFGMLETIRSYAASLLTQSESVLAHEQALRYIIELAAGVELSAHGQHQTEILDQAGDELDNIRALLRWSLDHDRVAAAATVASSLLPFWLMRGPLTEGQRWLDLALRDPAKLPSSTLAATLRAAGQVARQLGDINGAEQQLHESRRLYDALGDHGGRAWVLGELGFVAYDRGDLGTSAKLHNESLELGRSQQDKSCMATALTNLGLIAQRRAQWHRAMDLHADSAGLFAAANDAIGQGTALINLASSQLQLANHSDAQATLTKAAVLWQRSGERAGLSNCLQMFANIAAHERNYLHAVRLSAATVSLRQGSPARTASTDPRQETMTDALRHATEADDFASAWQAGLAMSPAQAISLALDPDPR